MWEHVFLACQERQFEGSDNLTEMAGFARSFCQTRTIYITAFCLSWYIVYAVYIGRF